MHSVPGFFGIRAQILTLSCCVNVKTAIIPSAEMSSALSLAIQKSTLHLPDVEHDKHCKELQHVHVGQTVCGLYFSTHSYSNVAKYVCAHAIKAAVAFCSDILGYIPLRWFLPVLSFYMLYMSYSNVNKFKAWLAFNNPLVISWTCLLMRGLNTQLLSVVFNIQCRVSKKVKN